MSFRGTLIGFLVGLVVSGTVAFAVAGVGGDTTDSGAIDRSVFEKTYPDPSEVTPVTKPNMVGDLDEKLIDDCNRGVFQEHEIPINEVRDICGMQLGIQQGVFEPRQQLSNEDLDRGLERVQFPDGFGKGE